MREYSQIISGMRNSLWLIHPDSLSVIVDIVNERLRGDLLTDEELRIRIESAQNGDRAHSRAEVGGGVGIVPIYGPIFPKSNLMTELSGATSLEVFRNDLRSLVQNDKVESIVLDIDSPGGVSDMVAETGEEIRQANEVKPVTAVANTTAASAAYWLGSQAGKFYGTDSGKVGSIGVYTVHEDVSKQDEAEGRKVSFVSAGDFKTAGNPHEPLTDEAREYIQAHVDELYDHFLEAVARGRNMSKEQVRSSFGDGRLFTTKTGHKLGMIDGVKTLDAVIDESLTQSRAPVRTALQSALHKQHLATNTLTTYSEVVDKEHSEPGSGLGGEPEPRESEDGRGYGSRVETPPPGREDSMEADELLTQIRERLNINAESDVLAEVDRLVNDVQPLREAEAAADARRSFREQFPDEFERMQRLETREREQDAKEFALRYERFDKLEGEQVVKSTVGFSMSTVNKIEEVHKKISEGSITHADLAGMLDSIAKVGLVDYSEKGSSRLSDKLGVEKTGNPRQDFAALVQEVMEEDELSREAAIRVAAQRDPELFRQYRSAPAGNPVD